MNSFHPTDRLTRFSEWLQSHAVLASLIILACALSVRLFFTYRADPSHLIFPDSWTYSETATSLQQSGSFLNKYHRPEITRTPGYPLFLAALMTVLGTDIRILTIAQTILVSFSVLVLYSLARRLLPPLMAFTGALLAALSPWGAVRAGFLLSDGLFLLLLIVLLYVMYLVIQHTQSFWMTIAGGGLVGGITSAVVFVRPVLPLIPLVAVISFILYPAKRARAWLLVSAMLICALVPLQLWKMRNLQEAQFHGFSDVSGKAAWQWLGSSVMGQVPGAAGDRWTMLRKAEQTENKWTFSLQEADDERWRLAILIFKDHPFLTIYTVGINAAEAFVHPQSNILTPAGLNFQGDTVVLGAVWAAFLLSAAFGIRHVWQERPPGVVIDRKWLLAMSIICGVLTLAGGVSFGAGARYRAPLELVIPLLAGVGVVRMISVFRSTTPAQSGLKQPLEHLQCQVELRGARQDNGPSPIPVEVQSNL